MAFFSFLFSEPRRRKGEKFITQNDQGVKQEDWKAFFPGERGIAMNDEEEDEGDFWQLTDRMTDEDDVCWRMESVIGILPLDFMTRLEKAQWRNCQDKQTTMTAALVKIEQGKNDSIDTITTFGREGIWA